MKEVAVKQLLQKRLAAEGLDWNRIRKSCDEVVLFGSYAVNAPSKSSDVDLLCIGEGKRFKSRTIDLIWYRRAEVGKATWLGSELANHVAHFGKWLHGQDTWSHRVFTSGRAIDFKRTLIVSRARSLEELWKVLRHEYRKKHATKVRRDLQRYELLKAGLAVKPSALLDANWRVRCRDCNTLPRALKALDSESLLTQRQVRLIGGALLASRRNQRPKKRAARHANRITTRDFPAAQLMKRRP
jgi:hypothetical protein